MDTRNTGNIYFLVNIGIRDAIIYYVKIKKIAHNIGFMQACILREMSYLRLTACMKPQTLAATIQPVFMREDGKRWLISRMKTSGSKRRYLLNGRYADDRHIQKTKDFEGLPTHESIKSTQRFYNGKINYGLLVRFLRGRVGDDWSEIHQEILARIPTKLMEHKEMIYWFVAVQIDFVDGRIWNRRSQQFVWNGEITHRLHYTQIKHAPQFIEFWVHPETNKLHRIVQIKPGSH